MSPLHPRVHPRNHISRRWWWLGGPALIAVVLVVAYLCLDLIVAFATQAGLDRVDSAAGYFKKVHVTIIHPGYDVYDLKVVQMPLTPHKEPLFFAEKVEILWSWREILRGKLVRRINIVKPRVMIPMRPGENGKPSQPPLEIAKTLESVPSAGLERLEVDPVFRTTG